MKYLLMLLRMRVATGTKRCDAHRKKSDGDIRDYKKER